ncbi:MAG: tripartite tricarboxylate transporter permease [Methylobacteriaceae bacterium]|jgi:putative tricarboxylic transport membrane protein|nr:tripartite tricarboxylate transporter permease [Methylobacteriaceae bacterium]
MEDTILLFINGIHAVMSFKMIGWMLLGTALGLLVGAIPGFTSSMATGLLLPMTFGMQSDVAMVFLISVYIAAIYGGSITAILLNTPGTPESSATSFDGYELTQKGKGCEAMGIAFCASAIGGLISYTVMFFVMKPMAMLALKFGPPEMFLIAVMGISVLAMLTTGSMAKTVAAGFFGLLLGTIGIVPTGEWRATFGSMFLAEGVQVVPAIIGFFAFSEIFDMVDRENVIRSSRNIVYSVRKIFSGMPMALRHPLLLLKSAVIGIFIGAIPAAGASVAAFVSYGEAKRTAKHPEQFGQGAVEGVVAPESANNASTGGALITTLALGVPGSSTCAVLLGAMMIQGLHPGPQLLRDQLPMVYTIIAAAVISQLIMVVMAVLLGYSFTFLLKVSTKVLAPALIFFCIAGAYAVRNAAFDVYLMFAFGILGWFMKRQGYSLPAVVLGIVLGSIADNELMRTYALYGSGTVTSFFTRPLSLIILAFMVLCLVHKITSDRRIRKLRATNRTQQGGV